MEAHCLQLVSLMYRFLDHFYNFYLYHSKFIGKHLSVYSIFVVIVQCVVKERQSFQT